MKVASVAARLGVVLPLVILAIVVHGVQAGDLGLYWDDSDQLMQPMQALDHEPLAFILSDTSLYLPRERPLGYAAFAIGRAAFAWSLPMVHWVLVALLLANAVLVARLARQLLGESWFAFAAGATFLLYPLSPLHAIWPATLHYHLASLLALFAILAFHQALTLPASRHRYRLAIAATAYAASLASHEVFVAVPLAFAGLHLFMPPAAVEATADDTARARRRAAVGVLVFVAVLAGYAFWRVVLLPAYGELTYATPKGFDAGTVLRKTVAGGVTALFPWRPTLLYIIDSRPLATWWLLALVTGLSVWLMIVGLARNTPRRDRGEPAGQGVRREPRWPYAAAVGLAMLGGATGALSVSPVTLLAAFGLTFSSRANLVAMTGVALAIPALLVLLVRLARRIPWLLSLGILLSLLVFGLVGGPGNRSIFAHQSASPAVLGRYSVAYALMLLGYTAVVVVAATITLILARRARRDPGAAAARSSPRFLEETGDHVVPAAIACIAALGALVHVTIKHEFAAEWTRHTRMLDAVHALAPRVVDDTFVLLVDRRPTRRGWMPYNTHPEISSYLLGVYGNWSVTGNTLPHVRFHRDGLESTYHGMPGTWFAPGQRGPIMTHAREHVPRIAYERVVMFEHDDTGARLLAELPVTTADGQPLLVRTNPRRVETAPIVTTPIWAHVTRR